VCLSFFSFSKKMPSIWCIGTSIAMASFVLLGVVLVGVINAKNQDAKDNHTGQYEYASARIINVQSNPNTCYEQTNCQKCAGGGTNPPCSSMIANNRTGQCSGSDARCCNEQCYRRSCSNGRCSDVLCFSFEFCTRCSCVNWNFNPLCSVISGTCHDPYVTVSFSDNLGNQVETSATRHCKIADGVSCANKFLSNRIVGDYIDVYYLRENSQVISLDNIPKYKMSTGKIVGFVFGALALLAGFVAFVSLIVMYMVGKEEHCGCSSTRSDSNSTIV
jgi:hypothetical protein